MPDNAALHIEPFEPYPKVPRLHREIVVTEKIDGSNAQILFNEEGEFVAGSRKRWLAPGKQTDNFGFAAWVQEHNEALFELLGPGRHYGEWWGAGIQRAYGLDHRRFSLFNPKRYDPGDSSENGNAPLIEGVRVYVVPVLSVTPDWKPNRIEGDFLNLKHSGSWAAPGYDNPEGIMIYHSAARQVFKWTYEHDDAGKERS